MRGTVPRLGEKCPGEGGVLGRERKSSGGCGARERPEAEARLGTPRLALWRPARGPRRGRAEPEHPTPSREAQRVVPGADEATGPGGHLRLLAREVRTVGTEGRAGRPAFPRPTSVSGQARTTARTDTALRVSSEAAPGVSEGLPTHVA